MRYILEYIYIYLEKWEKLKDIAEKWKGLKHMYGDVLDNVNWGRGASGTYFHKVCRLHVADE